MPPPKPPAAAAKPGWIWQAAGWPAFGFDAQAVQPAIGAARLAQGRLLGLAAGLQLLDLGQLQLDGWTREAMATAQIEGEALPLHSVRASVARRLGLPGASVAGRDARTEATLDVLQAAVSQWQRPLAESDLLAWHAALFPTGRSGLQAIVVGGWRTHAEPMQIVTPRLGRPDVLHYEAPASADVPAHMAEWLRWFNASQGAMDGVARAALAHLWLEAIHPFEDGNGRIGRAVVELALAQDLRSPQRLMSVSGQLLAARADYYAQLQAATGQPALDVTAWVRWFAGCVQKAADAACAHIHTATRRAAFWARLQAEHPELSASQRKALGKLFDAGPQGFEGGLSTEKYGHFTGLSRATAFRELTQLTELGLLQRTGQGRGTRYALDEGWAAQP